VVNGSALGTSQAGKRVREQTDPKCILSGGALQASQPIQNKHNVNFSFSYSSNDISGHDGIGAHVSTAAHLLPSVAAQQHTQSNYSPQNAQYVNNRYVPQPSDVVRQCVPAAV